jgi:multiple sugar transport system permease protein
MVPISVSNPKKQTGKPRKPIKSIVGSGGRYLLLILVAVAFLLPFYWVVITSLKRYDLVFTVPPQWLPNPVMWRNYVEIFFGRNFPFLTLSRNTLFYAGSTTLGTVISSCVVAYAFARLNFWGKNVLFGITLSTMMIPGVVTLIPLYVIFHNLHWVGTYAPLIAPTFLGNAFNIFLMRQFFMTIPQELSDAAYVDGANEFTILWRIMIPLVTPVIMVVAVFQFMWSWNDFMGPLIYLDNQSQYPLVLGLSAFQSQHGVEWQLMMAASVATTLPLLILFFFAQRYFIEGITMTGLKE